MFIEGEGVTMCNEEGVAVCNEKERVGRFYLALPAPTHLTLPARVPAAPFSVQKCAP